MFTAAPQFLDACAGGLGDVTAFEVIIDIAVADAEGLFVGKRGALKFEIGGGDFFPRPTRRT